MAHSRSIAIIGLGYVGLPVAMAFQRSGAKVLGFDINPARIEELTNHHDRTLEFSAETLAAVNMRLSCEATSLKNADFYIVAVPTPIDSAKRPDMSLVFNASRLIALSLKKGDIVVYESTVYPGATEEECVPVLEAHSGLRCGVDFKVGYSPERINPGDLQRTFETITKVVAGQDKETCDIIAEVYGSVVRAGIYKAPSIKVAEAAKVIENTQRDLNIALMNELSLIFKRLNIDTSDVLKAAATKWNFLTFTPGLVGGHCIGVDPYYLTYRAQQAGYHPEMILAGRRINDQMGAWIARETVKALLAGGGGKRVIVLGMTFKENVPDVRNSKVADIVSELEQFGMNVQISDPLASHHDCLHEYGLKLTALEALEPADAVILAVSHDRLIEGGWPFISSLLGQNGRLVVDVKAALDRANKPDRITLWRP